TFNIQHLTFAVPMSDDLSIQGTLAETTVPDLFRSLVRSSETGIVSLDAIGRTDSIYFKDGKIIFASSSDPDMGLGEILLRTADEAPVLSLLQQPGTVEDLCGRSYLPNFVTCRTLWGLLTVDLIRDAASDAVDERRGAEESEYEMAALVETYNSAFQKLFAL